MNRILLSLFLLLTPANSNDFQLNFVPYGHVNGGEKYHILEFADQGHYAYILEAKPMHDPERIWAPWVAGDWKDPNYVGGYYYWDEPSEDGRHWVGILLGDKEKWFDSFYRIKAINSREEYLEYRTWAFNLLKNND